MPEHVKVLLDTKELDRISAKLKVNRDAVVRKAAFEIESEAKQNAPYDTTALRNSIYTVAKGYNGYTKASGKAMGKAWTQGGRISETSPHPEPPEGSAYVGPCVEYAEYVEYPGAVRKGGERPYLTPAAEKIMQKYNNGDAWKELVE